MVCSMDSESDDNVDDETDDLTDNVLFPAGYLPPEFSLRSHSRTHPSLSHVLVSDEVVGVKRRRRWALLRVRNDPRGRCGSPKEMNTVTESRPLIGRVPKAPGYVKSSNSSIVNNQPHTHKGRKKGKKNMIILVLLKPATWCPIPLEVTVDAAAYYSN